MDETNGAGVFVDTDRPFCQKCGAKCKGVPVFYEHSRQTGKAIYKLLLRCPNRIWFLDGHRNDIVGVFIVNHALPADLAVQYNEAVYTEDELRDLEIELVGMPNETRKSG